jgi:hypothetical protein
VRKLYKLTLYCPKIIHLKLTCSSVAETQQGKERGRGRPRVREGLFRGSTLNPLRKVVVFERKERKNRTFHVEQFVVLAGLSGG